VPTAEILLLVVKGLEILSAGIRLAPELDARRDRTLEAIREMVREGREPSPEEFEALVAESDALTEEIRSAVQRKS